MDGGLPQARPPRNTCSSIVHTTCIVEVLELSVARRGERGCLYIFRRKTASVPKRFATRTLTLALHAFCTERRSLAGNRDCRYSSQCQYRSCVSMPGRRRREDGRRGATCSLRLRCHHKLAVPHRKKHHGILSCREWFTGGREIRRRGK